MSAIDFEYHDFQELTYEEFYDLLWNDVSEKIIATEYIEYNRDFIDNLTYDLYRTFQMSDGLTIRNLSRILESFFFNVARFKPNS